MGKLLIEQILSPQQGDQKRTIRIYLPTGYDRNLNQRYPVLYMHDGQNMDNPSPYSGYSWNITQLMTQWEAETGIGVIVVGIDTDEKNRIPEYTFAIDSRAEKAIRRLNKGELFVPSALPYSQFLVETLKPMMDARFRTLPTREWTGTFGSSCGGNISLFLGAWRPDVFGIIGAFSPAYWIIRQPLFDLYQSKTFDPRPVVYLDMGAKEDGAFRMGLLKDAKRMQKILAAKGLDEKHLFSLIDPQGRHTELFWQSRFLDFIRFAFLSSPQLGH
jgi:predicted alpha/beta superfamily hydrolase